MVCDSGGQAGQKPHGPHASLSTSARRRMSFRPWCHFFLTPTDRQSCYEIHSFLRTAVSTHLKRAFRSTETACGVPIIIENKCYQKVEALPRDSLPMFDRGSCLAEVKILSKREDGSQV